MLPAAAVEFSKFTLPPTTCSLAAGVIVPMPMLPAASSLATESTGVMPSGPNFVIWPGVPWAKARGVNKKNANAGVRLN